MTIMQDKKITDIDFLMSTPCCIVKDMGKLIKVFSPVENCVFKGTYKDCLEYLAKHDIKKGDWVN